MHFWRRKIELLRNKMKMFDDRNCAGRFRGLLIILIWTGFQIKHIYPRYKQVEQKRFLRTYPPFWMTRLAFSWNSYHEKMISSHIEIFFSLILFQEKYFREIIEIGQLPKMPEVLFKIFDDCNELRLQYPNTYREFNYTIIDDETFERSKIPKWIASSTDWNLIERENLVFIHFVYLFVHFIYIREMKKNSF